MAVDPIDLITVARAQQNPALTSVDSTYLQTLITAASQQIINWLNRQIKEDTYTDELIDGEGFQTLFLNEYPITLLTQVDFVEPDASITAVMPNAADEALYFFRDPKVKTDIGEIDFVLNNPSGFIRFPEGLRNIKITYKAGYAVVPSDIQEATAEVVVFMLIQGSANTAISSKKLGDFTTSFFDQNKSGGTTAKSATAFEILSLYRKFVL